MNSEKMLRMEQLAKELTYHTHLYNNGEEIISDTEWDKMYFELKSLEKELGVISIHSPTQSIVFDEPLDHLNKIQFDENYPMLSLDKTKDPEVIKAMDKNNHSIITMLKLDGLSCRLIYQYGKLQMAATRGDGKVGEDITHNIKVLNSVPQTIPYTGRLVIDGEIICKTNIFDKYFAEDYKNPRNFAIGSIRLLDAKESHKRRLTFVAWSVVKGLEEFSSFIKKLEELESMNFYIVPWAEGLGKDNHIKAMLEMAEYLCYPIDGLVYRYDDIRYYESLGRTAHHPLGAMAFKFEDETAETTLLDIEWTMGRTGVLTPVAIFEPIELEGTIVSRASLHNLSVMNDLSNNRQVKGDKLTIIKSNQIIPQVVKWERTENTYIKSEILLTPAFCPVCGGETQSKCDNDTEFLFCTNSQCSGKLLNKLDHFCSKKGLDIKGLSLATLEKLIELEWVEEFEDIFDLVQHKDEWAKMPGFGDKSVQNILTAIETARNCSLEAFISAIGIPLIGVNVAKDLCNYFNTWEDFITAVENDYNFWELDGFGEEKHFAIKNFDYTEAKKVASRLNFMYNNTIENTKDDSLKDLTCVITGSLNNFKNRDELKKVIEACGGKVVGTVSCKTNYLINNDINSTTSKNATARKLGIPIISEKDFIEKFIK